jgi:tetratricopeptide (TPR) repeat protein
MRVSNFGNSIHHKHCGRLLGELYVLQGRYSEARALFERTLALRTQKFGLKHLSTVTSMYSLAKVLYKQGEFDSAKSLFEWVLVVREEVFGTEHPDTVVIRTLLHTLTTMVVHEKTYTT